MTLSSYQQDFVLFLVRSGALSFGDFTLKSGRKAPYFVNTGNFDDGQKIATLGQFYARHIIDCGLIRDDARTIIFGPAYKGIPLCVGTAAALASQHQRTVGFAFDRKEIKDHGDGGMFVGKKLTPGSELILVEDVITAGTTLRKIVPVLRALEGISLQGVVIAVDRQERGEGALSAVAEARAEQKVDIFPLLTISQIISYLSEENASGVVLTSLQKEKSQQYLAQYGA